MVDPVISARQAASGNSTNLTKTTLTTDFNVVPYYDDYTPGNNYYRILYKPGYAVQARELTQMQSMLQNQIYRLGRHLFKEGSLVLPGAFTIKTNVGTKKGNPVDYVKLKDVDASNNSIDVTAFVGQKIRGATSNITAYVIDAAETDGTSANSKTLYVNYLSASSSNSRQRVFIAGETISSTNAGTCIVKNNDPVANTGYASWFQIEEGVYFAKEHFIYFPTQSIILDRYNPNPTCKVGFYVTEELINAAADASLLDPALESSNYSAPGADRLKLLTTLAVLPYGDSSNDPNFITLFTINNGVVDRSNEKTQYNILGDELATRTFDESGDYVIKGLNVQISEHDRLITPTSNFGRYANGNNSLLVVGVDPGLAYVKGYALSLGNKIELNIPKPRNFNNISSQIVSATAGQFLRVTEVVGSWPMDRGARVNFYDLTQKRITANGATTGQKWSTGGQTGNNIGSALIHSVQYVSGTPGYDAVYDVYLSDIKMVGSNSRSIIRSIYYNNSPHSDVGADILGAGDTTTNTAFRDVARAPLLYFVGSDFTKTVRDTSGNPQTIYYYARTDGISSSLLMPSSGVLSFTPALPANEIIPYGNTTLGSTDINQDLMMTVNDSFNIGPLFGASVSASGRTLTGTGFNYLNVGDKIEISGLANTFYITAISSNTSMTVSNTVPASVTGNSIFKAYKTGDILNLNGKGVGTGQLRTVSVTPTSFTIDLKETWGADKPITFSYKVGSTSSVEKIKTLRPNRYVKISCATAGTSGPFCLGLTDVYRIRAVIKKTGSAPSSLADGTNVTNYFSLDTGQKDTHYDLSFINKSTALTLGATDYLLVQFDYFEHTVTSRDGFFTVDSYPIQDVDFLSSNSTIRTEALPVYISPSSSLRYDLKNYIDFRPSKTATGTDSTTVAGASTNPANTSTAYNFSAATGLKMPIPSSEVIFDYSFYLGRRDIVVANKNRIISVVQGITAEDPVYPTPTDNQMLIATLEIAPYPSLSPAYANRLGRKDLSCSSQKVTIRRYTMRDIGVLDDRIKTLEYYASLSLLESDALNLKFLDSNGLDRFKNGIFVDTFKDESLSARATDPDYRIIRDEKELSILPFYNIDDINYNVLSTSGVIVKNGSALLTYTEADYFKKTTVTDSRNIERGQFLYRGKLTITPDQDVWIEPSEATDEKVLISSSNALLEVDTNIGEDVAAVVKKNLLFTTWEAWKQTVTGFNLYTVLNGVKTFQATYSTEAAARAAADTWRAQQGYSAKIETVYNNTRNGTQTFSNISNDTAVGSTKVISSETIPYIRSQKLLVKATNLKPYSKLNAFFDGVNVSKLCKPLTVEEYNKWISLRNPEDPDAQPIKTAKKEGDDLIVDDFGNLYFAFRIPKTSKTGTATDPNKEIRFRTGERQLVVLDGEQIDPQQLTDEEDASTLAAGKFFADGTKQKTQRTIYSTKGYSTSTAPVSDTPFTSRTEYDLPTTWVGGDGGGGGDGGNNGGDSGGGHCCFDPNAKVLMEDFTYKAISEIEPGDKVIGADGFINTVTKVKTTTVQKRKMVKFRDTGFYATDDHLFMTDKGWKTWRPDRLVEHGAVNAVFLEGDNRTNSIDNNDKLRSIQIINGKVVENFVDYENLGAEFVDFDSDFVVYDLTLDGNATYIVEGYVVHNCCVAYTVYVKLPNDEEGMFCTGYDIFVQRKSKTRGMWFEIREIDNAGNITNVQIPGTEKRYTNAQIPVSTNGLNNPMRVRFDTPVFLFNRTDYAFIIHSDSPAADDVDPDTSIWIARAGENDRNTGLPYNDRQTRGKFYSTTNNRKWDVVEDVDIPITVYRAKFTPGSGTIILGNKGVEKLLLKNVVSSFEDNLGQAFQTGDKLTFTGANGTISLTDRLQGNVSTGNANGSVIRISGSSYYMSNTDYIIGERVDAYYAANNLYTGVSARVATVANSTAILTYYDDSSTTVLAQFEGSKGDMLPNLILRDIDEYNVRAEIASRGKFRYSAISFEPSELDFDKTSIAYEMKTVANDSTTLSDWRPIKKEESIYLGEEKQLLGRTDELLLLGGQRSNQIRATMRTTSEYVSPLLDLDTTYTLYIDNLINNNITGEDGAYGGKAFNKYISQTVTLAEGQDAEDLRVYLSAYRPPGTDVHVYAKLLNGQDGDTFKQKLWTKLDMITGTSNFSSLADRNNFKEFTYKIPTGLMTGPNGEYQYTADGVTYSGFKYFAIKIVLTATNSAIVPRVADLRAIAMQM